MIRLPHLYAAMGLLLAWIAAQGLRDRSNPRRLTTGLFWGLLAIGYLLGDRLPPISVGILVLLLALLAGLGGVGGGPPREALARPSGHGNRVFLPALLIPGLMLLGVLGLGPLHLGGRPVLEPRNATILCLGLACLGAWVSALRLTGERPSVGIQEGRRLLDALGGSALMPVLLATLGSVFSACGAGETLAALVGLGIPARSPGAAVLAYCLGMTLLTWVLGNAFAAFPVMAAGVGLPFLVRLHGADPALVGALGLLSGYCGTLLSPMAANFNLVPALLLELQDPHAVIRAQVPTALVLLGVNVTLLLLLTL